MKFPKIMFVKIEDGGTGPDYFAAYDGLENVVEVGCKTKVATYTLTDVVECEGVVKVHPPKRKR